MLERNKIIKKIDEHYNEVDSLRDDIRWHFKEIDHLEKLLEDMERNEYEN